MKISSCSTENCESKIHSVYFCEFCKKNFCVDCMYLFCFTCKKYYTFLDVELNLKLIWK